MRAIINLIWLVLLVSGVAASIARSGGDTSNVTAAVVSGSDEAVKLVIGLVGILAFWSGLMRLAEAAGLTRVFARIMSPIIRRLFPSLPAGHPALGAMLLSVSANLLGLGNAATPLGIKAMQELATENKSRDEPSDAMCTFAVLCATGLTLVPGTVIALRAAAGSANPAIIVGAAIFATFCATSAGLVADRLLRRRPHLPSITRTTLQTARRSAHPQTKRRPADVRRRVC